MRYACQGPRPWDEGWGKHLHARAERIMALQEQGTVSGQMPALACSPALIEHSSSHSVHVADQCDEGATAHRTRNSRRGIRQGIDSRDTM